VRRAALNEAGAASQLPAGKLRVLEVTGRRDEVVAAVLEADQRVEQLGTHACGIAGVLRDTEAATVCGTTTVCVIASIFVHGTTATTSATGGYLSNASSENGLCSPLAPRGMGGMIWPTLTVSPPEGTRGSDGHQDDAWRGPGLVLVSQRPDGGSHRAGELREASLCVWRAPRWDVAPIAGLRHERKARGMSFPEDPPRLWTGSEEERPSSSVRVRSVERQRAARQPESLDVSGIRLRFAIAIALAALGMLIVIAGLVALS
jgi:hypothetical protein